MSAGHSSQPLLSPRETLAVITARIKERRLYEARFLCRKLGQGLNAEQRATLEDQLGQSLAQVEQLRVEAKAAFNEGHYERARVLYMQVEAVAIDVPGVREELQSLTGAEALRLRLTPTIQPVEQVETEVGEPSAQVTEKSVCTSPAKPTSLPPRASDSSDSPLRSFRLGPAHRKWIFSGLGLVCLSVLGLLWFFRATPPKAVAVSDLAPQPSKAVQLVESVAEPPVVLAEKPTVEDGESISELQAKSSTAVPEEVNDTPTEVASPPEHATAPAGPALNLGGLKIE